MHRPSSTQIKLFNVDCRQTPEPNHILRCNYTVSQSSTGNDCSNARALAVNCGMYINVTIVRKNNIIVRVRLLTLRSQWDIIMDLKKNRAGRAGHSVHIIVIRYLYIM